MRKPGNAGGEPGRSPVRRAMRDKVWTGMTFWRRAYQGQRRFAETGGSRYMGWKAVKDRTRSAVCPPRADGRCDKVWREDFLACIGEDAPGGGFAAMAGPWLPVDAETFADIESYGRDAGWGTGRRSELRGLGNALRGPAAASVARSKVQDATSDGATLAGNGFRRITCASRSNALSGQDYVTTGESLPGSSKVRKLQSLFRSYTADLGPSELRRHDLVRKPGAGKHGLFRLTRRV